MEFTMPEALTKWKFMGFAHDKELRSGFLQDEVVTAKDLMVQPNPPRFLREGDVLEFTVKVSNQSPTRQNGQGPADARRRPHRQADRRRARQHRRRTRRSTCRPSESRSVRRGGSRCPTASGRSPTRPSAATRQAVRRRGGRASRCCRSACWSPSRCRCRSAGRQTKTFDFAKLPRVGQVATRSSTSRCTVQMVSQPAWYAVMALPYLMEYPHECTRADVQPALRQRPGPAHRRQRPEDPQASSTSGRTRRPSTARWRRTRT